MKAIGYSLALVCMLTVIGCGGDGVPKPTSVQQPTPVDSSTAIKNMINDIANSGELGSGSESLKSELEKMKATDEAKAKALLADVERMEKMSDPEQIKAAAKKMAEKL